MIRIQNYYSDHLSEDYDRLTELLDKGYVVICFVDYIFDTGAKKQVFRDVAKVKVKSDRYSFSSPNYGYVVEARGIRYVDWDRRMQQLQGKTFVSECERLRLQFIDFLY